ncbi:MAG: tetratricopeptide repeat protein [Candidatus Aminicenantes bacterium]|nr:tetratricopeptide repeat protein [Candidatus Aminicenantes bacterium]
MKKSMILPLLALALSIVLSPPDTAAQKSQSADVLLGAALHQEEVEGNIEAAIKSYQKLLAEFPGSRLPAAQAQLHLGICYEKLGLKQAQEAFQKVVENYPEQSEAVKVARTRLALIAGKNGEASNQRSVKLLLSGTGSGGKLSPDETQVVYRGGEGNLLVKDLKTGIVKTVVKFGEREGDYAVDLVWSPDGKQVVYTYGAPMLVHDLRIGNIESGESRIIYSNPLTYPFAQDWSADGKSVVCMLRKGSNGTFAGYGVFDIETRKLGQFVAAEGGEAGVASFSPDGKSIVYDLIEKGNRDLFAYSVATGEKTRLTDSPAEDGKAAWSRDGKYVVFSSNRRGSWDLWAVPIRNAKTAGEPFLVQGDFGNKSKKMTRTGKLVYNVSIVMNDVYTLDVNPMTGESPGVPKLITTSHYGKHNTPAWSPDGKKIAYVRNSDLLCVRTLEDGREECIETGMNWIAWMSWSPDGKSIALSSVGQPAKSGVYLYSFESGKLSTIFESDTLIPSPLLRPLGWSLNGKEFLCLRYMVKDEQKNPFDQEVNPELIAIDVRTKEKRILERSVNRGWDIAMMQLSPDRTRMAYGQSDSVKKEIKLVVSDLKDQEKRALVTLSEDKAYILSPIWSPDGRMIEYHFVDRTVKPNKAEVRVIAVDGSWEKTIKTGKLDILTGRSQDAWSPDGTKLAVTLSSGPTGELWAMENFLPTAKAGK